MIKTVLTILLTLFYFYIYSQTSVKTNSKKIDSLLTEFESSPDDPELLLEISDEYFPDSPDKSLKYANRLLEYSNKTGDDRHKVQALNRIGGIHNLGNEIEEALKYYQYALKISENTADKELIRNSLFNVANIYYFWKQHDKTVEYYKRALAISEELGDKALVAEILLNLGNEYSEIKDYAKALETYYRSLKLSEELDNTIGIMYLLNNIGFTYSGMGNYPRALDYYEKALKANKNIGDEQGQSAALSNIGVIHLKTGDYKKALEYITAGCEISERNDFIEFMIEDYLDLSKVYCKLGDYRNAYKYHQQYSNLKDSIFSEKKHKQFAELQTLYETEKKEKEIEILKHSSQLQKQITYGILAFACLILIILFLIFNRYKLKNRLLTKEKQQLDMEVEKSRLESEGHETEKQLKHMENLRLQEEMKAQTEINDIKNEKLQSELDHKNREITSSTMHILLKNKILEDINGIIENINPDGNIKTKKQLDEIKSIIRQNMNMDEEWKKFKLHFENVHPDFFKRLLKDYPSLSQNELKHCAYMRINLSTKEIAKLLHIGARGVQTSRYRLKKKIQLSPETNLNDFLCSY